MGFMLFFIHPFDKEQAGLHRGMRFMVFSNLEIDVLRLTAWCKDLTVRCGQYIPEEIPEFLRDYGYLRRSRSGQSYRVTQSGYRLLESAGYYYEPDLQYRGQGPALTRRIQMSELMLFFMRLGINVFAEEPSTETPDMTFLPAFSLRRKKSSNILGGTRFTGFLYTAEYAFIPYYIAPENDGIYPGTEQSMFSASGLLSGRTPFVLYTGAQSLEELIALTKGQPAIRKTKSTTLSFDSAAVFFNCPVCYVPLSGLGLRQLRILSCQNYRQRLAERILGVDYLPGLHQSDARHQKTNDNYLIGIDCNLKQFEMVSQALPAFHLIVLEEQIPAIRKFMAGKNATLHSIRISAAEHVLGLSSELMNNDWNPFQTEKGDYLTAPLSPAYRKARTKD